MKPQIVFPTRLENLDHVENLNTGWNYVKLAIRPECREDLSIEKAKVAINAGLNDAAINYVWNLAIYDLQKKIHAYGIDYFASAVNWEGKELKTVEDLRDVKDYQIITGAFALGIIVNEAHFFLQQCREIRNNFSTAHYPMGQLDKFEAFNFIKNCVKYVLTFDPPAPGLQIKELIERLSEEELDETDDLKVILESQSSKIHGPILHSLFSNFIKNDCNPNLKHNVLLISPYLWSLVSDEVKSAIGNKFVSLRDIKGKDAANEALAFLKTVDGVEYIPESYREVIFKKHAQYLIDAHQGWNNFYTEPSYAKDLEALGSDVPITALPIYVKTVLLSFIGNSYGFSSGATNHNLKMIKGLSQSGIRMLFKLLRADIDVLMALTNPRPCARLQEFMTVIKDKTMLPAQKKDFDFFIKASQLDMHNHFRNLYWKVAKSS